MSFRLPESGLRLRRGDGADGELRAHDGADRFLLERAAEEGAHDVLVVDDAFGAIAVGLGEACHAAWGDSAVARAAMAANRAENGLPPVRFHAVTESPPLAPWILGRLPRSLRRLEFLAARLAEVSSPGTRLLFGARSKDVQQSAVAVFEHTFGPASTTRADHRARLIEAVRDERPARGPSPRTWEHDGVVVRAHPGVFGETKLDPGAKLLLSTLRSERARSIVDLGCGTGILGIGAARLNPDARVRFRDASFLAVDSARRTAKGAGVTTGVFEAADSLLDVPSRDADLVLCNPPFHAGRALTTALADRMIRDAARVVDRGGRLLLVGNRHLRHDLTARKHFYSVRVVGSDSRFVVISAERPRR